MNPLRKVLNLPRMEYFETHLNIINCVLPEKMSPTEIKVIAAFMNLEGDIAQYRFGPSAKKIVMKQLELSTASLSNHMRSLFKKGFLYERADMTYMIPILTAELPEQGYMFKLMSIPTESLSTEIEESLNNLSKNGNRTPESY